MQNILNQKGHLLSEIYATIVKRNENDEHLRQDRQVTVKDTETYVKHYTGHVFRSSREEVTSRSKNRTVTVPSVNELAFLDKELYTISLRVLSDSLAEVNRWLDINVSQMLDAEDAKAERKQKELMDRASGIGKTTFRWGMLFLIFVALLNVANTWRRSKVMKELEKESDKNKKLVEKRRQMMYAIVHDLRTPLSIVIGYNDMAKQCPTKNEKYISAISFSARRLRGMIDQLLDYFRLESNKGMLKPRDFSLMELVNELTNSFELRADERLIEFVKPKVQGIVLNGDYEDNNGYYLEDFIDKVSDTTVDWKLVLVTMGSTKNRTISKTICSGKGKLTNLQVDAQNRQKATYSGTLNMYGPVTVGSD
jgi:signal transduction histidine kinase